MQIRNDYQYCVGIAKAHKLIVIKDLKKKPRQVIEMKSQIIRCHSPLPLHLVHRQQSTQELQSNDVAIPPPLHLLEYLLVISASPPHFLQAHYYFPRSHHSALTISSRVTED